MKEAEREGVGGELERIGIGASRFVCADNRVAFAPYTALDARQSRWNLKYSSQLSPSSVHLGKVSTGGEVTGPPERELAAGEEAAETIWSADEASDVPGRKHAALKPLQACSVK